MVNCSDVLILDGIRLLRSNKSIVYLTSGNKIVWQNLELNDRTEAKSKTTCSDNGLMYLYIKISRYLVYPLKDIGPYLCRLETFSSDGAPITYDSNKVMLNITGNLDNLSFLSFLFFFFFLFSF